MKKYSLEAIAFQMNNSLGRDISSAITKVFQYRNSLDYSNVPEKERIQFRQEKIKEFCIKTFFPELIKIIKKDTGIFIKDVFYTKDLTCMFAIEPIFDDRLQYVYLESKSKGIGLYKVIEMDSNGDKIIEDAKEIAKKLSSSIDLEKSKVDFSKIKYQAYLYFDYLCAFCLYDFIPQSVVDEFTPDELTAIILHEIGHTFEFIEHCNDFCFKYVDIQEKLNNIKNSLFKIQDPSKMYSTMKDTIIPMMKDIPNMPESIIKVSYKTTDKINEIIEYGTNSRYSSSYLRLGLVMLLNICKVILSITVNIIGTLQIYRLCHLVFLGLSIPFTKMMGLYSADSDTKTSEVANSIRGLKSIESNADEFVSRHGYGSYLASSLEKITDIWEYESASSSMGQSFRDWKLYVADCKILATVLRLTNLRLEPNLSKIKEYVFGLPDLSRLRYDENLDRIKKLLVNARTIFKDNLPPEKMAEWILEYEKIQKVLEDSKLKTRNSKFASFMKSLFNFVIISPLNYEKELKKYEPFLKELNEIINNEFYYNSAKFRQLASLK